MKETFHSAIKKKSRQMDMDLKSIISVKHNCIPCKKKGLFIRYTLTVTSRTLFKLSEIGSVNQLVNHSNLLF